MKRVILEAKNLSCKFGGVMAVQDVSFSIGMGEIVGLIGPNGAGKSTLFNLCSTVIRPSSGEIYLDKQRIDLLPPHQVAALGLSRTFQNLQLFRNMTALENVMMGRYVKTKTGFIGAAFRFPSVVKEEKNIYEQAERALEFVGIREDMNVSAGDLPLGKQRFLELARALITEPKILLLDEIAAGLNYKETEKMGKLISYIREKETAIFIVEHDMDLIMSLCDRIIVLDQGRKIAEGSPIEIQNNPQVLSAYLGSTNEKEGGV